MAEKKKKDDGTISFSGEELAAMDRKADETGDDDSRDGPNNTKTLSDAEVKRARRDGRRQGETWFQGMKSAVKKGLSAEEADAIGEVFHAHEKEQQKKRDSNVSKAKKLFPSAN